MGLIEAGERGWSDSVVVGSLIASAVLAALFVLIERRAVNPMVPMRFFASRNFTGANLVAVATSFLIAGLAFALTMYFQNVHGYSAIKAGFTLLPSVLPMMLVGAVSGALVGRLVAPHMIAIGMLIASLGIFMLSRVGVDTPFLEILPSLVVFGVGNGLVFAPMMTTLMNSVESEKSGVASAVNGAIRETGFAFGIALLGTIMNQTYRDSQRGSSEFSSLRNAGDPALAPLQPVLDLIAKSVNFGGRVIENQEMFPGLPAAITEPIRIASSRAFVSGMEQAFTVSVIAMVIMSGVAWLLIRDEASTAREPEHVTPQGQPSLSPQPSASGGGE